MNELGRYYAKWIKPDGGRQMLYGITCMWNVKKPKTQKTRFVETKFLVVSKGRGRGKQEDIGQMVHTFNYKKNEFRWSEIKDEEYS